NAGCDLRAQQCATRIARSIRSSYNSRKCRDGETRQLRERTRFRFGRPATKKKHQAREVELRSLTELMEWLQASSVAVFIHNTKWVFTTIEVIHVIAILLVIGSIAVVDLRLLGIASTKRSFTELARETLPATWTAFVLAVIAGSLLFVSQATAY